MQNIYVGYFLNFYGVFMREKESLLTNFYDKIMNIGVHNAFLITVSTMFGSHLTLFLIMFFGGVRPLMFFNILSVVVYLFGILFCVYGHVLPVYVSIILEVTAYVVTSTYYLGWNNSSFCYMVAIIPVTIYFGANLLGKNFRKVIGILLLLNFGVLAILFLKFSNYTPPYVIQNETLKNFLVIFSFFIMSFSSMFYNAIYMYDTTKKAERLKETNKLLSIDVNTDPLTLLLNRRGFKEEILSKNKEHFCIAFIDIDDFKKVNDTYGHDAGDEILKHVTKQITKDMQGCIISRWGGEEIIIYMPDYDFEAAKSKMEYIRKKIENSFIVFYNQHLKVTITIGITDNDSTKSLDELIKISDNRLYYGKQHGKNVVISSDMK